jgi:hypothetical protein
MPPRDMGGDMRSALRILGVVAALLLACSIAWATFDCFDTPEGRRCACVGSGDCSEMQKSHSCQASPECDNRQLGAMICSCKAARASRRAR